MSNDPREYNFPNSNGQNDPYRRDINKSDMNNPNLIITAGNLNKPRANLSKWGKPGLKNAGQNKINNNSPQKSSFSQNNSGGPINNDFNKNKQFNENRPYESSSPPLNQNNSQSNFNRDFRSQERYHDDRGNYHQSDRGNFYDGHDNRYGRQYDNRNIPPNYNDNYRQANSDYRGSNYHHNDSNYGRFNGNYDNDRDRYRRPDPYERNYRSEDRDRERNRPNDRYEPRHHHDDRNEMNASLKRCSSSSTTSSASSASISSSASTNIHRTNSLPKGKLQPPNSPIPENLSEISGSPFAASIPDDSDNDNISLTTPQNEDDNHKKNIISSNIISRQEVVGANNNLSEVPETIKKLTKNNNPDLFISNPPENKEVKLSKPRKKISLISSNQSANGRNLLNEIEPNNKVSGLTPIAKKPSYNYSSAFENGISPFPEVKKGTKLSEKDKYFNSIAANSNVKEWIDSNIFDNSHLTNQNNESDKMLAIDDNEDDLDFTDFIREFNFDEDVLKRRDWQKNPESFIKKISSSEFDLDKNNDPIEAFIVSDKNDPFYYDVNLFTLEPVETEEEKINNLMKKFNLPDIHKYIEDQENKNKEEKRKATQKLREKSS